MFRPIAAIFRLLQFCSKSVIDIYKGCNRRNGPDFGRVFLMLYYTDITQNTYDPYICLYIRMYVYPKLNDLGDNGN